MFRTIPTLCMIFVMASAHAAPAAKIFAMPSRLFTVGPNPGTIACRDLNDDELPDIVTADRGELADPRDERPANDELSVLFQQDSLNFVRQTPPLKGDFGPYAIAIANVDSLKFPDIIVANFHAVRHRDIIAYLNQHNDALFEPVSFRVPEESIGYFRHKDGEGQPLFTKPGITSLAVQDVNGDGLRDLLATAWSSDAIVFMPGADKICFGDPQLFKAPGAPRDLRIGDLNGDGSLDFAVVYYATSEVGVWRGDGHGGFSEHARLSSRGSLPTTVRITDMNGDKLPDLVVSHCHIEDSVVIFYNDPAGTWACSQEICLGKDRAVLEHEIRDMAVDDFNGDGRPDIATACFASSEVAVLLNVSKDTRMPQDYARETYTFKEGPPHAVECADFDNDGRKDLAVALWNANAVGVMRNQQK